MITTDGPRPSDISSPWSEVLRPDAVRKENCRHAPVRGHGLGGCDQEEFAEEAAGRPAKNGVGRARRALRRICALSYRLAYKEYPDRLNREQAQEAIKRAESIAGPIHETWRIRSASRDTFYVESRHASGLVDRRTGEFTVTWSEAEKFVRGRMKIGY
jgi:hypothetical protein